MNSIVRVECYATTVAGIQNCRLPVESDSSEMSHCPGRMHDRRRSARGRGCMHARARARSLQLAGDDAGRAVMTLLRVWRGRVVHVGWASPLTLSQWHSQ